MFPLRCLSFLLLSAIFIHCDNIVATETLIEMKGDKLGDEETTESERVVGSDEQQQEELPELPVENDLRNLNKDYDRLGKIYVAQYYTLFDNPSRRLSLVSLFHSEDSFLSFDGESFRGTKSILEKFEKLNLSKIERSINSVDTQPLREGGLIVNVIGKVKANNDPQRLYAQTFIFRPQKGSFFLQHDIFRTILD